MHKRGALLGNNYLEKLYDCIYNIGMEEPKKINTIRKIQSKRSEAFFLVIRGLEVGVAAGLIAVLYRYMLSFAEDGLNKILTGIGGSWWKIALWLTALAIIGLFVSYIVKWEPDCAGSGIPQVTGEIKGRKAPIWWRVILAKLIGGTASVFAGLSLGREGPSVQLGGMAAKGVAKITKADKTTELRMISCGAGAGMAAAFNAPLAGIMFVLEEIHHSFDKNILCMGIVATVVADYVSKLFFGQSTIFNYDTVNFPLQYYWILVLLGIIIGLSGVGYTKIMLKTLDSFKKLKNIPNRLVLPAVFVFSGIVGLLVPQVLCGGHSMVEYLMNEKPALPVMFGLLVAKFLFGAICFACGAPGGTLYPLCILGTYLGASLGTVVLHFTGLPYGLWEEFAVIGMAGFFSATIKSPITGVVLVFELTGNMNNFLPLVTVALTSYAVSNLLGSEPIYDALLARISTDTDGYTAPRMEKIIKSFVIPTGSDLANKKIKDVDWGRHALIITVERGEDSITPNGDVELKVGDEIVFFVSQRRLAKTSEHLEELFKEQYKPTT